MAFRVGKVDGWMKGALGRGTAAFLQRRRCAAPQGRAAKRDRNPLRGGAGGKEKRTYVRYAFIRSHAACHSSSTSLGAWGNAAQKQSLLLERTGLVLLCHLEKAQNGFSLANLSERKSIRRRSQTSDPCRFRPIQAKPSPYFPTLPLRNKLK